MIAFEVEQAGCESCAARVRAALEPLGTVESVEIDEAADVANVRLDGDPREEEVNGALGASSAGSGHLYRVKPGSWRAA